MLLRTSIIFLALIISTGCSSKAKKKLGVTTIGPNEYQVTKLKPLDVPPHYDLPIPQDDLDILEQQSKAEEPKKQAPLNSLGNLDKEEKALLKDIK